MSTPQLGHTGWLRAIIADAVTTHAAAQPSELMERVSSLPAGRARARKYLRLVGRTSGLLYGTPEGSGVDPAQTRGPEERLFVAVLHTWCRLGLDVATLSKAPTGPRAEQLLIVLAAVFGRINEAQELATRLSKGARPSVPEALWKKVEQALEKHALSLAADPYYGLVLHNGAVYADTNLFGRLALDLFSTGTFRVDAAERLLRFAAMQKSLLVQVLVGLICAENQPSFPTRRAVLRQIDDLRLPEELAQATREFAQRAFERPPSLKKMLKGVRSDDMKRFIVEQTLLASIVDGRRSTRELAWIRALGTELGLSEDELATMDLAMAEFYSEHRDLVDVFTVANGAEVVGEEWVDSMSSSVRKNYRRLMREIRQTGELSVLLARAARGDTLSRDEKKIMREQLIDLAKMVPALAIFAAPGGLLLLIALAKVMPFKLLPSAFTDDERTGAEEPPEPLTPRSSKATTTKPRSPKDQPANGNE